MKNAIDEARKCTIDVPIGCVIKRDGKIIASAHNRCEIDGDITAHAEMLAVREAQKKLGTSRLLDCEMFVTLEPCPMCSWAIIQSGIRTVYFGAYNTEYGVLISNRQYLPPILANSRIKIYGGIEEEICSNMLDEFFKKIR